jgi:hypothetical protein
MDNIVVVTILLLIAAPTYCQTTQTITMSNCSGNHSDFGSFATTSSISSSRSSIPSIVPIGNASTSVKGGAPIIVPTQIQSLSSSAMFSVQSTNPLNVSATATPGPGATIRPASNVFGTGATLSLIKAQSTGVANFSRKSSDCYLYEEAVTVYCQLLNSGEGTILSPSRGICNDSSTMNDPKLLPYIFSLKYYPSEECSTYSNTTSTDADLAVAYHFEGKTGFGACKQLFYTDCGSRPSCQCRFSDTSEKCFRLAVKDI